MKSWWRRLVGLGFRLLYNELAWTYDAVSWLASLGRWRRWQQSALGFLPPTGRVLEIASGPGHLLADLARAGYGAVGLDPSPAMLRQARRRLAAQGLEAELCQGRADSLPLAPASLDAVVTTFPTSFVYETAWMGQAARGLRPGGRLVVVEMASFQGRKPLERGLEGLYRVTGQRGPAPDLAALLNAAGLTTRQQRVEVADTTVFLVVADKPPGLG